MLSSAVTRALLGLVLAATAAAFPMTCAEWMDGAPGACTKCCAWQPVDHFGNIANAKGLGTEAWQQRYMVEGQKGWSKDKPVFVVVNGNSALEDSVLSLALPRSLAAKQGALVIVLEHRFYGGSRPTGATTELQDLVHLSVDAAIADIKNFVLRYVRGKETGHPYTQFVPNGQALEAKGKIVIFGGGYGGALAAWTRQQFPGVVDGAVAVSAPMRQTFDFTEYFKVFDHDDAYRAAASTCRADLKKSLAMLLTMLRDTSTPSYDHWEKRYCQGQKGPGGEKWCGGRNLLEGMFNSTTGHFLDPDSSRYGYYFLYRVADVIGNAALYQNPSPVKEGAKSWQLDATCKLMEGADCDALVQVKSSTPPTIDNPGNLFPAPKCITNLLEAFKYNGNFDSAGLPPATQEASLWNVDSNWMQKLKNPAAGSDWYNQRAWWWQKCTEMGFFKGTGSASDIFSSWPTGIDPEVCDTSGKQGVCKVPGEGYCSLIFGGTDGKFNKKNIGAWVAGSSARYSGKDGFGGSSVYFANGRSDPWNVVSVTVNDASANVMTGTYSAGHMAPLAAVSPDDPSDLTAVRSAIADFINDTLSPTPTPTPPTPTPPAEGGAAVSIALVAAIVLGLLLVGALVALRQRSARGKEGLLRPSEHDIKQHVRGTSGGAATNLLEPLIAEDEKVTTINIVEVAPAAEDGAAEQATPVTLREDETADSEAVAADLSA